MRLLGGGAGVKISVVTVCFNSAGTLEEAIVSVAAQQHAEREHIVVDGGSNDGTREILARHRDRLAHALSEPDGGMYDAMNKGMALATGEVVGFLNADDRYAHDGVLSRIAEQFADPRVGACYADLVYVDKADTSQVLRYWKSRPYQPGLFEKGWMPAHPTFYARRSLYQRLGGYNTAYRLQSDFDLTLRFLAVHGVQSVYIPEIWVEMRSGGASARVRNVIRGNLEAYRAARSNGLRVTPFFMVRKILSRVPQFLSRPG
jgi:glycosyltransferase involved in cell wall biosynthesis